ncbi:sugar ABC transporter permease [Oceanobacillus kimchii]|uniref:Sugar ABC transporter permease n=1 Tax=Oceanobacillus kimchii TaxID=746691 RepID=A0ABQ5TNN1_9BACI|nr:MULTISPECIES: sugar ABC transporter permease [Oceanobacillus]MBT2599722.1 sugar ABC transporter permease [Oceanobacillus sp. ISL-74]MCT1576918.1 sugar ABC transporter permease [Oceanobacillus kimchii]MCT2134988.1 sugar ABC transporter permease [Oceanobacillus kimchii]OEH56266.1 sugar ABC transporter permease [Oceanobacillus sp. E9]GLO67951.1 sugar ABC transporter permease [Oceanobacillus kimchii]
MNKRAWMKDMKAIPFLLPFFLAYMLFTIVPIFKGLEMSLYDWNLVRKMEFVGIQNYVEMFNDPFFWQTLWNTTLFVLLTTPTMVILALGLALLANLNTKWRTFFRSSFFLPSILSVAVISFLAIFMLQPYNGLINNVIQLFGIQAEPFWMADKTLAWISIVLVTLWWSVGFNMILFLTSLQEIPDSYYEASEIDGATRWEQFRYITLPQLIPIGRVIILLQILASYKVFAQILLITGGGPGGATRPLIQYIYEVGFTQNNLGYAATMSYALFFILLILSIVQLKNQRSEGN